MVDQQTSDTSFAKLPNFMPFFNFAELMQRNSKLSTTLQAVGKEWSGFVQARLREDTQLLKTLSECREFPSMQRAYIQFWEKALSQYEEETQRLMRIAQGAVEDAAQTARETQGIEATNGSANGRGAASPPEPKKARSSHRDSA
jgi:hypothetical protein